MSFRIDPVEMKLFGNSNPLALHEKAAVTANSFVIGLGDLLRTGNVRDPRDPENKSVSPSNAAAGL